MIKSLYDKIAHSNLVRMMETALYTTCSTLWQKYCSCSQGLKAQFYLIRTMTDTVTDCLVEGAQVPRSVARVALQNKTAVLC
jgi:hypothetical protein